MTVGAEGVLIDLSIDECLRGPSPNEVRDYFYVNRLRH